MNEPTATQTVRALVEQKGAGAATLAMLQLYWKPVSATAAALISVGTIIQQGRDAKADLAAIKAKQELQAGQYEEMKDKLTKLEAEWGALFGAARINVVPNKPEPQQPKRKPP